MPIYSTQSVNACRLVLRYAVDDHLPHDSAPLLEKLQLSHETFYREMYVGRDAAEKRIIELIQLQSNAIIVVGPPGSGKTSTVTKVLRALSSERMDLVFRIDFKSLYDRNPGATGGSWSEGAAKLVREQVEIAISQYLLTRKVQDRTLLQTLMSRRGLRFGLSAEAEKLRKQIADKHLQELDAGKAPDSLREWYEDKLEAREEVIVSLADQLARSLDPHEKLWALTRWIDSQGQIKAIVCLDNTDSIGQPQVRSGIYRYIRTLQASIGDRARVLMTARPRSLLETDWASSDYGAYQFDYVHIDTPRFWRNQIEKRVSGEIGLTADSALPTGRTTTDINEEGLDFRPVFGEETSGNIAQYSPADFDRQVIQLRIEFLRKRIGAVDGAEPFAVDALKKWFDHFLGLRNLRGAVAALSNLDRRLEVRALNRFAEYLGTFLNHDELGADARIGSTIDTCFYYWLRSDEELIDYRAYDPIADLRKWERSKASSLGCMLEHLILALIYNLQGYRRGKVASRASVQIRDILQYMNGIGVESAAVIATIRNLRNCNGLDPWMLEISRHRTSTSAADVDPEDEVALSPRACFILEYLSYKLTYLIALSDNRTLPASGGGAGVPKTSIRARDIGALLETMCRMAEMHLSGLRRVRDSLTYASSPHDSRPRRRAQQKDWFQHYRQWFCLDLTMPGSFYGEGGNLQLENMLNTHIKYLRSRNSIDACVDRVTTEQIAQFVRLREWFNEMVSRLAFYHDEPDDERDPWQVVNLRVFRD